MVINCTPHDVNIYTPSGCYMRDGCLYRREDEIEFPQPFRTYPAAKEPARVIFVQKTVGAVDGILIYRWFTEEIVNLPDPKPGTYYIVSKRLAQACPERKDLVFPGTVVRCTPKGMSAHGRVVGCIDFSRV